VATPEDPSSARYNEPVYTFYFRTIIFSYLSAWKIANDDCRKKGKSIFSITQRNGSGTFIVQLILVAVSLFLFAGWQ
jgi:alkane 1-monooxygenase